MTDSSDMAWYIQHGKEEHFLEYKSPMTWTRDDTKIAIAKAMMAMSNLREGGVIVVGMKEIETCVWEPEGLSLAQSESFNM